MFHPIHVIVIFVGAFVLGGWYQKRKDKKDKDRLSRAIKYWMKDECQKTIDKQLT